MLNQPEITVVMATYKQAKWLPEAIESILGQGCIENLTVEGVQGDSETEEILMKLVHERPYRTFTVGFSDEADMWWQRQWGLREMNLDTKSPYVCFFDSDDVMLPGWLEKGLKVAEEIKSRGKIPIVGPSYRMVDEKLSPLQDVILPNWSFKGMMEGSIIPDFSITTTEALRSVGGLFDPDWDIPNPGNSYAMWLRLLKKYKDQIEVRLLPDIGFLYRQHKRGMHNKFQSKRRSRDNVERQRMIAKHYFPEGA